MLLITVQSLDLHGYTTPHCPGTLQEQFKDCLVLDLFLQGNFFYLCVCGAKDEFQFLSTCLALKPK